MYKQKKSAQISEKILGNCRDFSIENRCFIGVCFFSAIAFFISVIANYLIGLPTQMILGGMLFGILFGFFYYFSRFKREERFNLLLESAPDAIFVHHNGEFVYMNTGAVKLFGAAEIDDLLGSSLMERIHPDYHSTALERIQRLSNKENTPRVRLIYLRMDGSPVEAEVSAVPIDFHKKNCALVFARDISDRREVEDNLEHQNQRMKTILENIPFGYIYIEAPSGKIVQNNTAAKKIIDDSNIPVKNIDEFMRCGAYHQDGRRFEAGDYPVAHVLSTGEPILRRKIYYPATNERAVILATSAYPIHAHNDEITGVINLFKNITSQFKAKQERSRLKEQLYQVRKMEAIGTLAEGIAHDFNNILSGMLSYSQLTKMHIKDFDRANRDIDQVIKGIQRANDLVKQILTFSRRTEHEKRPLKISIVVKEALKLFQVSIPSTIKIEKNIATNSNVLADPTQIHQVVMNLCTNAYHAMQETGGTLTVKLKEIKLSKQDSIHKLDILPGAYVKLEINDTGQGMGSDTLNKIFEPYFTTKAVGKGTGLGLAIVHKIVEDHHGYIDVLSKPGRGTGFQIFLPAVKEKDKVVQHNAGKK